LIKPFTIEHTVVNNNSFIHLKNGDSFTATIVPSVGAMLHQLKVKMNDDDFNLIDNYSTSEITPEAAGNWFKGVKLSPWPCRIPDGKYRFRKKEYAIQKMFKDGTALHGLLYDQPFQLVDESSNEETAWILLRCGYEATDAGYPFPYDCEVKYAIHTRSLLEVETKIHNLGETEMPIADGWHPYFRLGGKVDDWELNFPAISMVEFDSRLVPTGTLAPYQKFKEPTRIGKTDLDNCFFLKIHEFKPVCSLRNPANNLALHIYTNPSYSYLQIFIPPHRNSIAIENLSGPPDAFNNGMGLITLQPRNTVTFRVFYQVEVQENL
jgi:aldose 1-epimerase